jgi:hypothetical protein
MIKRIKIVILAAGLIIGQGCITAKYDEPDFNYSTFNIEAVEMSDGSSSVHTLYTISNNKDQILLNVDSFSCGELQRKSVDISGDELNQVLTVLKKHNVQQWNNFRKSNDNAGGHGFGLKISGKDGKFIEAHGDGQFPAEYDKYETELKTVLATLLKK